MAQLPPSSVEEWIEKSLDPLALSNENEGNANGEGLFPFLDLPDELLGHTFSFLSIEDRLRARVNRRLNKIEAEYKYYVDKLYIEEGSEAFIARIKELSPLPQICFDNGRSYSSMCIKRLTQNLSIGYLSIELTGASDFHREVYNLIKDFNIGRLYLRFSDEQFENEMMTDSFFLDLSRACKELNLERIDNITPSALHQVYKMMMEGSTKLRKMNFYSAHNQVVPFLELIGITYRDPAFFTNRDIEGFQYGQIGKRTLLFDGSLEIDLGSSLDYDEEDIPISRLDSCVFKLHNNKESIDVAKTILRNCVYTSIDFTPE